jgi:hypothetical protein
MFNRIRMILAVALARGMGSTPLSLQRMASDHNRTVDAMRTVTAAEGVARATRGVQELMGGWAGRIVPRSHRTRDVYMGRNGAGECARRVRQIERGQLTVSNGLLG